MTRGSECINYVQRSQLYKINALRALVTRNYTLRLQTLLWARLRLEILVW
jgi:hypothetical protein